MNSNNPLNEAEMGKYLKARRKPVEDISSDKRVSGLVTLFEAFKNIQEAEIAEAEKEDENNE
jgi:hypothetical protein